MYHAICPECKNDINLDREKMEDGEEFECPACGLTLAAREIDETIEPKEIKEPEIVEKEK